MKLAICALSYKRPDGLARLLEGLRAQTFVGPPPDAAIVIVDNDPEGTARETCERLAPSLRWPLKYVIERQRGIAYARNAALTGAADADWIAFIDDDEVPDPAWLETLIATQKEYDADVVGGPVLSYFPQPVPEWLVAGGFFKARRRPTGQRLTHAFTGNVLFRRSIIDELNLRFDVRWALMGCEDRAFFQRVGMAGYKIVWADDAVATEWVPASRVNPAWLIQRHYRVGNSTSFIELDLRPKWKWGPILLAKSLVWALIGVGFLTAGVLGGRERRLRGRRACAYAAGLLTGLLGIPYEEYRRTHAV